MRSLLAFAAACSALTLTACNDESYMGSISSTKTLTLQTKDGQTVKIPAGTADARIHISSSLTGGKAEIVVDQGEEKPALVAVIKLPSAAKPNDGGDIAVPAGKLKQNFDLVGTKRATVKQTEEHADSESCVSGYHDGETRCEWVNEPETCTNEEECGTNALGAPICKTRRVCSGGGMKHECHTEQIPEYGSRSVRQYEVITTTKLNLQFRVPGTTSVISKFSGQMEQVETHVTNRGSCY